MTKYGNLNLEDKGDYSIEMMNEIYNDIINLSKYSSSNIESSLDDINRKIDLAREYGLNVESLDKQVLDFRVILFKNDIENKIEEIEINFNYLSFDISRLEKEYSELKQENGIDLEDLNIKMNELLAKVTISKIKFMINNISKGSDGIDDPNYDKIAEEISIAEKKGINVDEIKDMIYG